MCSAVFKCFCSVFFYPRLKQDIESVDREERDPYSVRRSHTGAKMTDAPLERREEGREQKDGGNERKSKEENQKNKNDTWAEEERDEEFKSIYLLFFFVFFCCCCFQEFISCPTVQKFFFV